MPKKRAHVRPTVASRSFYVSRRSYTNFCCFLSGVIQQAPTGISLWMGGHDLVTEGGWEWMDGSPFRYIRWSAGSFNARSVFCVIRPKIQTNPPFPASSHLTGSPDDFYGEDCLSIYINDGYWNDDNCEYQRGYICKRRGERWEEFANKT